MEKKNEKDIACNTDFRISNSYMEDFLGEIQEILDEIGLNL